LLDERSEAEILREELQRYRSVFESASMIVGHELIKPLTSISGYVELLEDRFSSSSGEDEKRYFSKLRESIRHLHELVESFVLLLRFDSSGDNAGVLERVNVRELVEKVRPLEGRDRSRLKNAVDPQMQPVRILRKHIEVVLDNLVSNALKYSGEEGDVTVRAEIIRERRAGAGENVLLISVEDEGVGIPEDQIEEIFNPFFRGGEDRLSGGLGLGLALVKNIIDIMRGEIRVSSSPGRGTEVTIAIPLRSGAGPGESK
jgi:two-component system sensor histidine kinase VicK